MIDYLNLSEQQKTKLTKWLTALPKMDEESMDCCMTGSDYIIHVIPSGIGATIYVVVHVNGNEYCIDLTEDDDGFLCEYYDREPL